VFGLFGLCSDALDTKDDEHAGHFDGARCDDRHIKRFDGDADVFLVDETMVWYVQRYDDRMFERQRLRSFDGCVRTVQHELSTDVQWIVARHVQLRMQLRVHECIDVCGQ
jgi:hypothetical protein